MSSCVILAQPLYGSVPGQAHGNLMVFFGLSISKGWLHGYHSIADAYIDRARNSLVADVLHSGRFPTATHLLFVDQDMILPGELVRALLDDDVEVVSAAYFEKDLKASLVGWQCLDPAERLEDFDETALQSVAGFGMGACLIRTSLLRDMERHFGDREWYRSERGGEDLHFCRRLQEMGVPFWLDGRVQCGHLGGRTVTITDWKAARQALVASGESV